MLVYASMIIASLSIIGTITTTVLFLGKLRWEIDKHAVLIKKNAEDIDNVGEKVNSHRAITCQEWHSVAAKVQEIDIKVATMSVTLEHIVKIVDEIKAKLQ
jgi:NADH/NAD ratio-sensing transcriptional regulator Rex